MMEILLTAVVTLLIGFKAGWIYREYKAKKLIQSLREDYFKNLELMAEQQTVNETEIVIEKYEGSFFVYDKNTGNFLAQGKSHDEVSEVLSQRFPNTTFIASLSHLKEKGYDHESL